MAIDATTLNGLNQLHVNLKKHFDTLNKGGPLPAVQAEIANLGRTVANLGTMINQMKTQTQTAATPAATPGAPVASAPAPAPVARTSSLHDLVNFADYLDSNGFHALSDKIIDVVKIGKQTGKLELIKLADYLDNNEFYALADKVDEVGELLCMAEDYGFIPKTRTEKENDAADEDLIQPRREGSLSTRYCPDHRGVQAIRIEESTYQCPIDGKKYNYEMGYVNYAGQKVPGGNVAAQTPATSDFGGIPMRIYDSRSDVLNRLN